MESVSVEIVLKLRSEISKNEITVLVHHYLQTNDIKPGIIISNFSSNSNLLLHKDVEHIVIGDFNLNGSSYINFQQVHVNWYVYKLNKNGPHIESDEDGKEEFNLSTHWVLPSASLFGLWENLYYDNNVKNHLLNYSKTMMEFADKGVDCHVVSCNRVILLHGPPGTGKTSLCKALAQKLSIQMQDRFNNSLIIEINSHSLFSKWFSESAKLVSRMFSRIRDIVENQKLLVCVLIDEVESLAHARDQCISGQDPSDSLRVVNAVLTEIDHIRTYSNVLILATSNMTQAIDIAFVDRADIKQYLGLPSVQAIYNIYSSCIKELLRAKIIVMAESKLKLDNGFHTLQNSTEQTNGICKYSRKLAEISELSVGLSGRTLRKVPFLAHALFSQKLTNNLEEFFEALEKAVEHEKLERKLFYH